MPLRGSKIESYQCISRWSYIILIIFSACYTDDHCPSFVVVVVFLKLWGNIRISIYPCKCNICHIISQLIFPLEMCIFRKFKWKFKCRKCKSKGHKLHSGHHRIIGTYLTLSLKKLGNICEMIIFRYWTNQYRTVIPERKVTNKVSLLNSPFLLLWEFFGHRTGR